MSFRGKEYIPNDKFPIVTTVADIVDMLNYEKKFKKKPED